ncbi:MAG TPA: tRNA(His) guanylyltransferase Thg1 family protein [Cyclobacteriaceae bacterium]
MTSYNNKTTTNTFDAAITHSIAPEMYMIARLHGRGIMFHDDLTNSMVDVTEHLMTCGFNVTYAHTTLHEISLLFHIDEQSYHRNPADIAAVLAGEASARLTYIMSQFATFDCTMVELANKKMVKEYFQLRSAEVDTINMWSYWESFEPGKRELVTVSNQEFQDTLNDFY